MAVDQGRPERAEAGREKEQSLAVGYSIERDQQALRGDCEHDGRTPEERAKG